MKFFSGFIIGAMSGVALEIFQSQKNTSTDNSTNLFHNIKDLKDTLVELKDNASIVPEVVSGLQSDITNYAQDIAPDVENLKSSVSEMKDNLEKFQEISD
ncbi:YtxH domain-containing protein [Companilactobacillus insicii]|uniref:YtxH domain-containing protein n=1 Tax=Companilactobacillus insicii TaxID=1732567 RepID=UPI000F78B4EA|nr:YtxH domain-containing protein [Companilactobacillus insicii]